MSRFKPGPPFRQLIHAVSYSDRRPTADYTLQCLDSRRVTHNAAHLCAQPVRSRPIHASKFTHGYEEPMAIVRLLRYVSSMLPHRFRKLEWTNYSHSAHGLGSREPVEVSSGERPAPEDLCPAESPTNLQANAHPASPLQGGSRARGIADPACEQYSPPCRDSLPEEPF